MKYAAIADWATDKQYSVTFMCAQLGVARQGYYRWLEPVRRALDAVQRARLGDAGARSSGMVGDDIEPAGLQRVVHVA